MRAQKTGSGSSPLLRLFVAGTANSAASALANRRRLIDALKGTIEIEVIDILERPGEAEAAGILATPTLSDDAVYPPRRLIGDLSDIDRVLQFFGYHRQETGS